MAASSRLTYLHLANNQLSRFDAGKSSCLLELSLQFNQLASLDLRGASSLRKLAICYNPQLGSVRHLPLSLM
jgi:Leucine-rich repeat (LRR) protein